MPAEVGQPAPSFELSDTAGVKVSLEECTRRGPTVLLFFPLAFTPVCTNELTKMRDDFATYKELGANILAASVDSPFSLKVLAEQLKLPFPLLSDFNKETAAVYGALYDDLMGLRGVAKRSAFIIDTAGVIRYRWVTDDAGQLPRFDEIKEVLKRIATT
ncbi:MAG: redoxin domain-containing protein [Gemmatimonadota bacterium]|nr:MAG: redoxin domain-containing protein [Gemmatimonadota bacterium]